MVGRNVQTLLQSSTSPLPATMFSRKSGRTQPATGGYWPVDRSMAGWPLIPGSPSALVGEPAAWKKMKQSGVIAVGEGSVESCRCSHAGAVLRSLWLSLDVRGDEE